MISIEEIIAQQKRELTTQKQQESGKGTDKGFAGGQGHLSKDTSKGKEKEKGITIKEPVSQSKQVTTSKGAPSLKKMVREKLGSRVRLFQPLDHVQS